MHQYVLRPIICCICVILTLSSGFAAQPPKALTDRDYRLPASEAEIELGRLLFFDKILSGNRNIACSTCHHPRHATGDGLSLPVGEGGHGLGPSRNTGNGGDAVVERVPRNAPAVFNLGAKQFTVMFHDGRVRVDHSQPQGFRSPAGHDLPPGLDNVLAAQAMFPVTSATEMAGRPGRNPIADRAAAGDLPGVWAELADRLRAIPAYVALFRDAFDDVEDADDITFVHAANAMAAFQAAAWRADDSPFDRHLRGDAGAMDAAALRGMDLFYGKARCSKCHKGPFQTDHKFYPIAMPQIGPGKGDGPTGHEDFGWGRETGKKNDRYMFRTPSLRNVALTGPWGHAGSYATLRAAVEHHLDAIAALRSYDTGQAILPSDPDLDPIDFSFFDDPGSPELAEIADAEKLKPVSLTADQVDDLIAFLRALTDPASDPSRAGFRDVTPNSVPSGLPVAD